MQEIYLPTLHWFAMENPFTGSCGEFRFRAVPKVVMASAKEVDFEQSTVHCEYWHGLFCYEKSEMEGASDFPLTAEGLAAMKQWLQAHI